MLVRLGFAIAAMLTCAGCGGAAEQAPDGGGSPTSTTSESSKPADSPTTPPEPELSNKQIGQYVEDLFSQDPVKISRAMRITAPGSTAEMYTKFRLAVANSNLDGGYPMDAWSVTMGSEEAQACQPSESTCSTLADFDVKNGKLAGFTVDGKSIDKRLVGGSEKVIPVGGVGTVQFIVAYKTVSDDDLAVAIRLKSGPEGLGVLDSYYRSKSGRQTASMNISGPMDLGPNSSANYTLAFPSTAQPGGTATLNVYVDGGAPTPVSVEVR